MEDNIENEIRALFEQMDPDNKISEDQINSFVSAVRDMKQNPPKDGDKIGDATVSILEELKTKLNEVPEKDWRQRASIAARIISLGL